MVKKKTIDISTAWINAVKAGNDFQLAKISGNKKKMKLTRARIRTNLNKVIR